MKTWKDCEYYKELLDIKNEFRKKIKPCNWIVDDEKICKDCPYKNESDNN